MPLPHLKPGTASATLKRKKGYLSAIYPLWVVFSLVFPTLIVSPAKAETRGRRVGGQERLEPRADSRSLSNLNSLRHVKHRVRPGESITRLFSSFGLKEQERRMWLNAIQKHYPIKALHPGQELDFYFARAKGPSGAKPKESLKALEIELNEDWILAWEKGSNGIVFSKHEKPHDIELKTVGGTVESSLAEDGARLGIPESLLSQLADIFSWDIDFHKDIRPGDTFKLVYEQKSRKGKDLKTSFRLLAAELVNAGQKFFAIYFEKEKGKGAYYDLEGRSLARAFLRFPLEFTSISSQFSHSRFHPILKVDRPHNGVDFVAKRGTPVRAVADGKVLYAGWRKGGYGRMVEIAHDSVYSTRYAHLEKLAAGLRRGAQVKRGQIIGYVGSTGRSTGAHLHFELYRYQEYVDPLSFEYPPEDRIEPALRRVFDDAKQLFLAELAATPHS